MILAYNPLVIQNCSFFRNNAIKWFEGNCAMLTIIHCTIKEDIEKIISGSINTDHYKTDSEFINHIQFTKDGEYCQNSDLFKTYNPLIYDDNDDINKYTYYEYLFIICFLSTDYINVWF